jgi:large subunit ribosomal protein L20
MPRAKGVVPGRARKRKVLNASKGAFQGRRKLYRIAKENLLRAMQYAYRDRRVRKRMMRRLWILRINAAARQHGLSYSRFIQGLHAAQVEIDRKMLSDLAVHDGDGFAAIVAVAKKHLVADPPTGE